ncbi:MAG: SGNH/GDSL hydrolase family protein [Armatimonadetes bacterium]|nr:SGNH/GDSL hydrolase family protein [Armatimonadota bacterium]
MQQFLIEHGQTVVFIGDSITDAGRRAEHAPFGAGYVRMAIDLITARYPERQITYFNEGIGGNTVADLHARWEQDGLAHSPDWISIMIGINDLHRVLRDDPTAVPPEQYETLYREILQQAERATSARFVLLDPFYICKPEEAGEWEKSVLDLLDQYIEIVERLAGEFDALHVPTHQRFQEHLKYRPASHFCPEPVHPNPSGHMVIALSLVEALQW